MADWRCQYDNYTLLDSHKPHWLQGTPLHEQKGMLRCKFHTGSVIGPQLATKNRSLQTCSRWSYEPYRIPLHVLCTSPGINFRSIRQLFDVLFKCKIVRETPAIPMIFFRTLVFNNIGFYIYSNHSEIYSRAIKFAWICNGQSSKNIRDAKIKPSITKPSN